MGWKKYKLQVIMGRVRYSITIKKCPLEFTKNMSMKLHPRSHENSPKVSTRIHLLKITTRICPLLKKVSTRSHCLQEISLPFGQIHLNLFIVLCNFDNSSTIISFTKLLSLVVWMKKRLEDCQLGFIVSRM